MKFVVIAAVAISMAEAQIILEGTDAGAVGNANSASFSAAIGDENVVTAGSDYSIAMGFGANAIDANAFVFAGTSDDGAGDKPSQGVDTATFWVSDIYLGDRALGAEITTNAATLSVTNTLVGSILATASVNVQDIEDLQDVDTSLATGIDANTLAISTTSDAVTVNSVDIATNTANIAANTANIATNTANVDANTVTVTGLVADVTDLQADVIGNADDITDLQAGVDTNSGSIDANSANIDANAVNIATNAGDIDALETDVADLIALDAAKQTDIDNLQADVAQAQSDIADATAERATLQTEIDTVAADLSTTQSNLDFVQDTLNDSITNNAAEIQNNADDIADALAASAAHTANIDEAQTNIDTNAANIQTNADDVAAVTVTADANAVDIAALLDAVSVLQAQVAELTATTEAPPTPAPDFAYQTGSCDGVDYCTIETASECETAAATLGFDDTVAGVKTLVNKVAGCYTTGGGSLIFNNNLASTETHNDGSGQSVICALCDDRRALRGF